MGFACWIPKARIQTLIIFNIYCFSTAIMVTQTRLRVTLSEFCDCFLRFQTCVWSFVVVLEDLSNTFVRLNSPETLLQGFKSLYRSEWMVCIMSTKITPSASILPTKKQWPLVPLLKRWLPRRSWAVPFHSLFVCSSKWWIHLIFVFPCINIYGFIRTSLMQIV